MTVLYRGNGMKGLMVLLVLICSTSWAGAYNSVISIGDAMPEWSQLPAVSGELHDSADVTADVVVLVSLANHCPWVRGMDPDLVALASHFSDEPVEIIGFSVNHREDDRLPAMKEHAKANGYNFTYLYDESQALGRALGATRTPEYFVFNASRELVYTGLLYDSPAKQNRDGSRMHINGAPAQFYVADAIDEALAGQAVTVPETRAHGCSVKYEN